MNLVGSLGDQNLNFPVVLKNTGRNKKKIKEKLIFDKIDFGFWCSSTTKDRNRYM